jgi:hypothetical protein
MPYDPSLIDVESLDYSLAPQREGRQHCTAVEFCRLETQINLEVIRVGRNHNMYGVYTVCLAGKPQNIRSYTVYIYGSGQP